MDPDNYPAIVIDHGSSNCKAGLACEEAPRLIFSSLVGRRRQGLSDVDSSTFVGDNCQEKRHILSLSSPVERGLVVNWDDAEKIWDHVFAKLGVSPKEHPLFFSEPHFNPKAQREKMTQTIFERYETPAFYLGNESFLVLMAYGRNCGTVLHIGDGCTSVASYSESHSPLNSAARYEFGGKDLTMYLQQLLVKKGFCFTTPSELEIVREIKERLCQVEQHHEDQGLRPSSHQPTDKFKLPDGSYLHLNKERFDCPEIMFQPDGRFNSTGLSVTNMVQNSIMACDISYRRDLHCNILISGGSTLIPGFPERLKTEIANGGPWSRLSRPRWHVVGQTERLYHVWIGGSVTCSLTTFSHAWITKEEYEEFGPTIVHRKCIGL